MSAEIVVSYADGRVKVVDPALYTSGEPFGANVLSELTVRLDRLAEGLYVEVGHHEPPSDADPQEDPAGRFSGRPYMLVDDCHLCLAEADEVDGVISLEAGGRRLLSRVFGELVCVERVRAALCEARGDDSALQELGIVSALYLAVPAVWARAAEDLAAREGQEVGDDAVAEAVSAELGTSVAMVRRIRSMAADEVPGMGEDVPDDEEDGFYDFG